MTRHITKLKKKGKQFEERLHKIRYINGTQKVFLNIISD